MHGKAPYAWRRGLGEVSFCVEKIEDEQERAKMLRVPLDHLTEQTDLQFEVRRQPAEVWFVTEKTASDQ